MNLALLWLCGLSMIIAAPSKLKRRERNHTAKKSFIRLFVFPSLTMASNFWATTVQMGAAPVKEYPVGIRESSAYDCARAANLCARARKDRKSSAEESALTAIAPFSGDRQETNLRIFGPFLVPCEL